MKINLKKLFVTAVIGVGVFVSQPAHAFMGYWYDYNSDWIQQDIMRRTFENHNRVFGNNTNNDSSSGKSSSSKSTGSSKSKSSSSQTSSKPKPAKKAKITFKSDGSTRGLDYLVNNYPSKQRGEARTYLKKLQENIALTDTDFREICKIIDDKSYDIVQLGALLVLISEKSLYPESLTAFVNNILEYSTTFEDETPMIDVCGTGGDGFKTINISTAVAFILGAMGVTVAKHGNRAISSKSGSSDVLDKLGVPLEKSLATQIEKLHKKNLAFFHAPFFHKLVGEVREVRSHLGIRTVFNILGPLLHPNTKLKYQLVGLYHEPVHRLYAETLQLLGREHALVVRGNDGLDEITICDDTKIIEVKGDQILEYTISPESFGFKRAFHSEIEGGTAEENAEILKRILKGEEKSAKFDIVVLNAMFGLYTANVVDHPAKAKEMILEAIESGKVYEFYENYVK